MNCTRVLHALGSHPQQVVMPVDLAMYLSQRQPLYQLLAMSPLKPTQRRCQTANSLLRTSLRLPPRSSSSTYSSPVPSEPRSCFRRDGSGVSKKRVVFADAKGLALTAVRLFIPEPSSPAPTLLMKPSPVKLQGQQLTSNKLQRYKLRLGFPQPTLDSSLARLREMRVQLESCNISEHSLSGKVRVSHVSGEKAVHVRLTFDSWRSHHDIPCTFLQQQRCEGSEIDVFTFDLSLPKNIDPQERIEFCVSLRPGAGATPHWDDNGGQNYRVCVEKDDSDANQGVNNRYYPTLSKRRPPSWPSNVAVGMKNSANLQRSLSCRVRTDWKNLNLAETEISPYLIRAMKIK